MDHFTILLFASPMHSGTGTPGLRTHLVIHDLLFFSRERVQAQEGYVPIHAFESARGNADFHSDENHASQRWANAH